MMRYGVPGTFAAAVETSASMGGLLMPPMMGVGAFLMSEFLGVPYWDVVMRGFALAFVYYVSIGIAVYLLCVRLLPRDAIERPVVPLYDKIKTSIFFSSVLYLLYLMGVAGKGELVAALYTAIFMFVLLVAAYLAFRFVLKDPAVVQEDTVEPDQAAGYLLFLACLVAAYLFRNSTVAMVCWLLAGVGVLVGTFRAPGLVLSIRRAVETHAEMTSYLTLLLATLGIMIGLFTVTGFINRMGATLLDLGAWNIIAMIVMAWVFGWLAGAGLPPTATYIIGAVVIVRPMTELGVNPWVAHFFVFLMSVWGELSPPTSLTAAVSARIANASFLRTMYEALKICLPITLMTFAIFARTNMVVNPGWAQIGDTILVLIATCGITFAMFGRYAEAAPLDMALRSALAAVSFVVMFYPDPRTAAAVAVLVLVALMLGIWRHRQIARPEAVAPSGPAGRPSDNLAPVLAEAKRDVG
jgi:TRAP-type uncharacterized transport system fused permease subunit